MKNKRKLARGPRISSLDELHSALSRGVWLCTPRWGDIPKHPSIIKNMSYYIVMSIFSNSGFYYCIRKD